MGRIHGWVGRGNYGHHVLSVRVAFLGVPNSEIRDIEVINGLEGDRLRPFPEKDRELSCCDHSTQKKEEKEKEEEKALTSPCRF